jgi:dienelactone hydrolase
MAIHPRSQASSIGAVVLALFLGVLAATAGESAAVKRLNQEDLLEYHRSDGSLSRAKTPEEWQRRREEIMRGVESVMGRLPGKEKRCPLDVQVLEEVDCGSHVRRLVTYASEPGSRVPAYLLVPKAASAGRPAPAALCLHGTDNVIGHGVVITGLGGKPNRQYASELADRGFVALAPNYPLLAKYQPDLKALGWESGTLKAVWDNMRGLDLLDAMPEVKHGAYGAIGHSLGGHNSVYTAVFDDRIKAVVSSCGLDSYRDYKDARPELWVRGQGWCQDRYMAKLADYRGRLAEIPFDFHELLGMLAPRPVFLNAPLKDSNFKWKSVDGIVAAARKVYELYGAADALSVEHPDCEHDFPPDMRERAYALFERVLR